MTERVARVEMEIGSGILFVWPGQDERPLMENGALVDYDAPRPRSKGVLEYREGSQVAPGLSFSQLSNLLRVKGIVLRGDIQARQTAYAEALAAIVDLGTPIIPGGLTAGMNGSLGVRAEDHYPRITEANLVCWTFQRDLCVNCARVWRLALNLESFAVTAEMVVEKGPDCERLPR